MAFLSTKLPWELAQTKWSSILNPIIRLPLLYGNQIRGIDLTATVPRPINHLLQRLPQGWFLIDKDSNATVWRALPWTETTITLESSADSIVDLYIY